MRTSTVSTRTTGVSPGLGWILRPDWPSIAAGDRSASKRQEIPVNLKREILITRSSRWEYHIAQYALCDHCLARKAGHARRAPERPQVVLFQDDLSAAIGAPEPQIPPCRRNHIEGTGPSRRSMCDPLDS